MSNRCGEKIEFGLNGLITKGLECQNTLGHKGQHCNFFRGETYDHKIEYTVYWKKKINGG